MAKQIIKFCYRKIIDAASVAAWDKLVYDSTYAEFKMQAPVFQKSNKQSSFAGLLQHNPSAKQLHFLVSAAVTGYIALLNGVVPEVLNNLGRHFLSFQQWQFEIINSDTEKKDSHQIAINFFSDPMQWHDTVANYLLLSPTTSVNNKEEVFTHLLELKPFLTIHSIKQIQ